MISRELTYARHARLSPRKKKPGPTARARAKRRRKERPIIQSVRAQCVERDGYCRLALFGDCDGPSEWMHLEGKKRARTRGMAPEARHTTSHSMMGCSKHHALYDAGILTIEMGRLGADGPITARTGRSLMTEGWSVEP